MTIATATHLEQKEQETTKKSLPSPSRQSSSRKSQRVYRSPSDPNDPSPFTKLKKEGVPLLSSSTSIAAATIKKEEEQYSSSMMEIDEKDEEAGTILMALAQHASRISRKQQHTYYDQDEEVGILYLFVFFPYKTTSIFIYFFFLLT